MLVIGGAMANTFLAAEGHSSSANRCSKPITSTTALRIVTRANGNRHAC